MCEKVYISQSVPSRSRRRQEFAMRAKGGSRSTRLRHQGGLGARSKHSRFFTRSQLSRNQQVLERNGCDYSVERGTYRGFAREIALIRARQRMRNH